MHSAHLRIYCRADVLKEPPVRAVIIVASLYWLQLSFNRRMLSSCRHLSAAQTHNLEVPVSIERERERGVGGTDRERGEKEREKGCGGGRGMLSKHLDKTSPASHSKENGT